MLGNDPEMSSAVWCADGVPHRIRPEEFKNTTLAMLEGQTPLFGDIWAELGMQCVAWNVRPKWRYPGFFDGIRTRHPILWIGTSGDHVCPIVNAHKMAHAFPGSVALEQVSEGHCSTSAPSLCTSQHVRSYFQAGELPDVGTKCQVEEVPFQDTKNSSERSRMNAYSAELWDVIKDSRRSPDELW